MTRRERGGDNGGKGRRVYRNNYKGLKENNKGEGNRRAVERAGVVGKGRRKGRKLYLNNNKQMLNK